MGVFHSIFIYLFIYYYLVPKKKKDGKKKRRKEDNVYLIFYITIYITLVQGRREKIGKRKLKNTHM